MIFSSLTTTEELKVISTIKKDSQRLTERYIKNISHTG